MKMPLNIEQKGKLVEFYFETKSIVQTQWQYQRDFAVRKAPDRKTIWGIVKIVTVHHVNKGRSGRTRGAETKQNIEAVRLSIVQSPKKSCRRRSQELGLSRMSTIRILRLDLKLFTYHIQVKQKLTAQDEQDRVEICNWFNDKIEENKNWINNAWFTDEAHCHLDGYVNSKTCAFWGIEPPQVVLQWPLHSSKVTA